jgi:hypothetical protein
MQAGAVVLVAGVSGSPGLLTGRTVGGGAGAFFLAGAFFFAAFLAVFLLEAMGGAIWVTAKYLILH